MSPRRGPQSFHYNDFTTYFTHWILKSTVVGVIVITIDVLLSLHLDLDLVRFRILTEFLLDIYILCGSFNNIRILTLSLHLSPGSLNRQPPKFLRQEVVFKNDTSLQLPKSSVTCVSCWWNTNKSLRESHWQKQRNYFRKLEPWGKSSQVTILLTY